MGEEQDKPPAPPKGHVVTGTFQWPLMITTEPASSLVWVVRSFQDRARAA